MKLKLVFIGFGTVAQGLCEILISKRETLKNGFDFEWELIAVSDFKKGAVLCNDGLNAEEILSLAQSSESLEKYSGKSLRGLNPIETIRKADADVVIEVTYTNIENGEPATSYVKEALKNGKSVVSSNKGPAALHFAELKKLASENNVLYLIEGTVMSGTPVISFATENLAGAEISEIRGILNGTSNFILTEMAKGKSYAKALSEAQSLGFAEADPTADVEGYDALAKIVILANVLMNANLKPPDVIRKGISQVTPSEIKNANSEGRTIKLIAEIKREGENVYAAVSPQTIDIGSPLGKINGATNAISFKTDLLGEVTVIGPGAGKKETGFALLSDLIKINKMLTLNKF